MAAGRRVTCGRRAVTVVFFGYGSLTETTKYRYRVTYRIDGRLRFLSHKELMRVMMRACRRARLPLAYSQGFHPHTLMSFGPSRPVGMAGTAEQLDVWLTESRAAAAVQAALAGALPAELPVVRLEAIPPHTPAISACVRSATYACAWPHASAPPVDALDRLLAQTSVRRLRRTGAGTRECDLRPGIQAAAWRPPWLVLQLALEPALYVRPQDVLAELTGWNDETIRRIAITRTALCAAGAAAASTTESCNGSRDYHRYAGTPGTPRGDS